MRTISLTGQWQGVCHAPSGSFSYAAAVPGCAYSDMLRIGRIENPFWRMNNQQNNWIEQSDFTFSRSFRLDELSSDAYLEFDGLDTFCSVFLNDVKVGDVIEIAFGEKTLRVRVTDVRDSTKKADAAEMYEVVG